jgi:hypothetical protein
MEVRRLYSITCAGLLSCNGGVIHSQGSSSTHYAALDTASYAKGRITSSGSGGMRVFHGYDARGRTVGTQHALDDKSYTFGTTYGDAAGTVRASGAVVVSQRFPDNELVHYV